MISMTYSYTNIKKTIYSLIAVKYYNIFLLNLITYYKIYIT